MVKNGVSNLVSYWMGWEYTVLSFVLYEEIGFNPSFLLDGLGILRSAISSFVPLVFQS